MKFQLLKQGIPVAVTNDEDEADDLYAEYDCDEIREVDDGVTDAERYGYDTDTCMADAMECGGL